MARIENEYNTGKQIFKYSPHIGSPVSISADTVTAVDGKKIVPAGSVIGTAETGKTILLDHAKGKVVTDGTAEGILINDVDVTHGDAGGTIATRGIVYANALPVAITTTSAAALKHISQEN